MYLAPAERHIYKYNGVSIKLALASTVPLELIQVYFSEILPVHS